MRILLILSFCISSTCVAGKIHSEFPENVDPDGKYVFYSHGFIVEGEDPTPESPRWGIYDFPKVKEALADDSYSLIAYHRPKGSDAKEFARSLADNVLTLIEKGVDAKNISLLGFSRGGAITIFTSNLLAQNDITFIILAGCGPTLERNSNLTMHGNVYSIIEVSDDLVGSCQALIDRSEHVQHFEEISISTGKEHGAFYLPRPEWLEPVKKWLAAD